MNTLEAVRIRHMVLRLLELNEPAPSWGSFRSALAIAAAQALILLVIMVGHHYLV